MYMHPHMPDCRLKVKIIKLLANKKYLFEMETFLSFTQMKYEPSNEHVDYFFFKKRYAADLFTLHEIDYFFFRNGN